MNQITCCVFDLETSSLNADFGVILCGVVKPAGKKALVFRADELNPGWDSCRSDDSAVTAAIVDELSKHDIWIAHNGRNFDTAYLRTRLAKWGMDPLPNNKLLDPLQLARNKLKMSYNSLKQLAGFLGVDKKTDVDPDSWIKAALDGCRKSMDYIVRHCVRDVDTLESVVNVLKHYSTNFNSWGSGF